MNRDESPYKIFESLNAKGKALSQADLARNYIAMRLPTKEQEKVFDNHWSKIENLLQEKRTVGKSRIGELTAFLRHYLAMNSRNLCAEAHIYARFRDRCEKEYPDTNKFIQEIEKLRYFAEYYNKLIRPQEEKDKNIQEALIRLSILDLSTAYPFLLAVYDAYHSKKICKNDFIDILSILENYLVRRYICGESTNYLNKMFTVLWHDILKEMSNNLTIGDSIRKILSHKRYPSDKEISTAIQTAKLYEGSQEKLCFVLESINRHLSKNAGGFTVLDNKPTIEHILPQKPNQDWKNSLGKTFEKVYQDYLHTLGNLTLVTSEWNGSLSNRIFLEKKEKLAHHALKINSDYFSQDILNWNETTILQRSGFIIENFLEVWASFGEVTSLSRNYSKSPKSLTIRGEKINISDQTWLQFRILTVEWGIKSYPHFFDKVRQNLTTHFSDDPSQEASSKLWHRLTNGVWLSKSYSAKDHLSFCRRFLSILGISESEWSLEEGDS